VKGDQSARVPTVTRRPHRTTALLLVLSACTLAQAPGEVAPTGSDLPSGYGTLRQEDVSLGLVSGDLRLLVTPLHGSIIRVTAPDTERRLAALAASNGDPELPSSALFLVSFYSDRPDTRFDPDEVQILSQGFRHRPTSITPLTPSWGERRLGQREQVMAVYRYAGSIDLESDLVLSYGREQTSQWRQVLARVQAERARVRARAGLPGT
jgi:hypothetical protein